ncbi:MAG: squalene-hopene/tetraprenyl-beta-curcumene cyclase [Pirellulaceae bacterium]|jgi:squalene-hopene/tetraprenyl-beta-curcumene cyclase
MFRPIFFTSFCCVVMLTSGAANSAEPVTLENFVAPAANKADEPLLKSFSIERATNFLDSSALQWQQQRKCMTCHTNYAFLYARPGISSDAPAHVEVRRFAEQLVTERWKDKGPRWDAEVVATAAALAFNDAATTGKLHEVTRQALDRMWTVQQKDGGWSWLKCGWPPMESDDHYGVTLAAIATGVAPGDYAKSPVALEGMMRLRQYLNNNKPPTLHHRAMLLWAASYTADLISAEDKQKTVEDLLALQQEDGGWALATLGNWKRGDGKQQDLKSSDGYGTAFVIYAVRRSQLSDGQAIERGVKWLKANQRESGRWYTRSLNKDNKHFISHAGTAMAILALKECNELR